MAIINRSALLLALSLMISMSSVAHCYSSQQNDAVSSSSSSAASHDITLPISARVNVLGSIIRYRIPQARAARSAPLVANVDVILLCGDDERVAAAQTLSEPSGAFDFTYDIASGAVSNPLELAECRVVVTFPGGACVADLSPVGTAVEQALDGGGHTYTYYVPEYKTQEFRPYNYHG